MILLSDNVEIRGTQEDNDHFAHRAAIPAGG